MGLVRGHIASLRLRNHRAVADDDPLRESVEGVGVAAVFVSDSHAIRIVVLCKAPG